MTGRSVGVGSPSSASFASRPGARARAAARCRPDGRRFEPLLQQPREREIHVVAAEQDVLADRDALERQRPRSPTAIRLKSVVPPPTSQTSTRSPTLTRRRQRSPSASSQA